MPSPADIRRTGAVVAERDVAALREFYFSAASNYRAYKAKRKSQQAESDARPQTAPAPSATPARGSASSAVAACKRTSIAEEDAATKIQALQRGRQARKELRPAVEEDPSQALFAEREQRSESVHKKLESLLGELAKTCAAVQSSVKESSDEAQALAAALTEGDAWKSTSAYQPVNLAADAGLTVPVDLLTKRGAPHRAHELRQESAAFAKLEETHKQCESWTSLSDCVAGISAGLQSACEIAEKTCCDCGGIARLGDALHAQLDHTLRELTLGQQLEADEKDMAVAMHRLNTEAEQKKAAMADGGMELAEGHHQSMVAALEEMQSIVLRKLATVERVGRDHESWEKVRRDYARGAASAAAALEEDVLILQKELAVDAGRLKRLREHLEDKEEVMLATARDGVAKSDAVLAENSRKASACWESIAAAQRELQALERERFQEVRARCAAKKEEVRRRNEFSHFCRLCDDRAELLELTQRDCAAALQALSRTSTTVRVGFASLEAEFARRAQEDADTALGIHKEHLEVFRGLFLALGEVAHRKERGVSATDRKIQEAHIKLELTADTFDPVAKRFSEAKRDFNSVRAALSDELAAIRKRAARSLERFIASEQALQEAGISFVHPLAEEKQRTLASRERMVELKEYALAKKDTQKELETSLRELRQDAADVAAQRSKRSGGREVSGASPGC
eukprot:TRINITY_DN32190_c0_g1_i1.p1 TRINITY_DN32190_c0_g1~~TRINITY_DN32190_c0_g1_i1.p1  ORF type:complete len:707 (+),score=272.29 TRINITY_DN32190_c0_g1_i1:60-2123(+)